MRASKRASRKRIHRMPRASQPNLCACVHGRHMVHWGWFMSCTGLCCMYTRHAGLLKKKRKREGGGKKKVKAMREPLNNFIAVFCLAIYSPFIKCFSYFWKITSNSRCISPLFHPHSFPLFIPKGNKSLKFSQPI